MSFSISTFCLKISHLWLKFSVFHQEVWCHAYVHLTMCYLCSICVAWSMSPETILGCAYSQMNHFYLTSFWHSAFHWPIQTAQNSIYKWAWVYSNKILLTQKVASWICPMGCSLPNFAPGLQRFLLNFI